MSVFGFFFCQKNAETKTIRKNWWYLKNKQKLDHDGTKDYCFCYKPKS